MRSLLFCILYLVFHLNSIAQNEVDFQNASLEGTPQAHVVPAPWNDCFGTPDTQPGTWGITKAPSNGTSYVSMLCNGDSTGSYFEGMSQQLSSCLDSGTTYTFTVDLAFSNTYNTAEPLNCYGSMEVIGGDTLCDSVEVVWQSGMITNTSWQTYTVTFTPSSDLCYLTFRPYFIDTCDGFINCLIDNFNGNAHEIYIDQPQNGNIFSCVPITITGRTDTVVNAVILSGDFTGSPINATLLTDTTWEATINYPSGFSGTTGIMATGQFQNDTTLATVTIDISTTTLVDDPEICIVTVDSASQKNLIVWEKPISQAISHYNIYKETNQNGVFNTIATVDYDSLSTYIDSASNPTQYPNKYKITLTDTCGVESALSNYHKTMHLHVNPGTGNSANLFWNHYEGFSFPSYIIHRGNSWNNISPIDTIASNNSIYTDPNPPSGINFYAIEAVHPNGCTPSRNSNSSMSNIANVDIITGFNDLEELEIKIYPNPTKGIINIRASSNKERLNYRLHDLIGETISTGQFYSTSFQIDMQEFPSGTYLLEISNIKGRLIQKIILE